MPKLSFADHMFELDRLVQAGESRAAELSSAGKRVEGLRVLVARLRELKNLQQSHLAAYRQATRELEQTLREAKDRAISLRSDLKAEYGHTNAALTAFGIKLRRPGRRRPRNAATAKPDGDAGTGT
jgi:chromosome segregation ATPase